MSIPTFYHTNLFGLGVLSGSTSGLSNLPARVADGDISLVYNFTEGDPPIGVLEVTLSGIQLPDALALVRANQISGYRMILESEDVGGGNNVVLIDEVLGAATPIVYEISGSSAREVWRLTLSGVSGMQVAKVYEVMLADAYAFARPMQVGVPHTRIRQVNRIEIPGGQPFTQQLGPTLQQTTYEYVMISGDEVIALENFFDAIDDGASVLHQDDRGRRYWAEVMKDLTMEDEAGVFTTRITAREVRVNGMESEAR